jgi:hypothetical protein
MLDVIGGLPEPANNIVDCTYILSAYLEDSKVFFLFFCLKLIPNVRWISANVGLAAFVLEIDLRLIDRRVKQVISMLLHPGPRRGANAKPIQSQGVSAGDPVFGIERQEILKGFFLAAIEHVALIFRDDESEARDLGWEVA